MSDGQNIIVNITWNQNLWQGVWYVSMILRQLSDEFTFPRAATSTLLDQIRTCAHHHAPIGEASPG